MEFTVIKNCSRKCKYCNQNSWSVQTVGEHGTCTIWFTCLHYKHFKTLSISHSDPHLIFSIFFFFFQKEFRLWWLWVHISLIYFSLMEFGLSVQRICLQFDVFIPSEAIKHCVPSLMCMYMSFNSGAIFVRNLRLQKWSRAAKKTSQ